MVFAKHLVGIRTSMVYKFVDKKSPGRGIKSMPNQQLTNEFHKPIIRKLKKEEFLLYLKTISGR